MSSHNLQYAPVLSYYLFSICCMCCCLVHSLFQCFRCALLSTDYHLEIFNVLLLLRSIIALDLFYVLLLQLIVLLKIADVLLLQSVVVLKIFDMTLFQCHIIFNLFYVQISSR